MNGICKSTTKKGENYFLFEDSGCFSLENSFRTESEKCDDERDASGEFLCLRPMTPKFLSSITAAA